MYSYPSYLYIISLVLFEIPFKVAYPRRQIPVLYILWDKY
jgi:hypothetical protein